MHGQGGKLSPLHPQRSVKAGLWHKPQKQAVGQIPESKAILIPKYLPVSYWLQWETSKFPLPVSETVAKKKYTVSEQSTTEVNKSAQPCSFTTLAHTTKGTLALIWNSLMAVIDLNKQTPEQPHLKGILPMRNTIVCHLSRELYRTSGLQQHFLQIHKHEPEHHTSIPSMTKAGNSLPPSPFHYSCGRILRTQSGQSESWREAWVPIRQATAEVRE